MPARTVYILIKSWPEGPWWYVTVPRNTTLKRLEELWEPRVYALDSYNGRYPPILHFIHRGRICTPGRTVRWHRIRTGDRLLLVVDER